MSDDGKQSEVFYRLARSAVHISGTVTEDFDPRTTQQRRRAEGDVAIEVEADPRLEWRCWLHLGDAFAKGRELDIRLTADGRITLASATVTGAGAAIVEAGIRVVSLLGSFIASAAMRLGPQGDEPPPSSMEDVYAAEQTDAAELRTKYRDAVNTLRKKLAEYSTGLAGEEKPGRFAPGLRAIQAALDRVRAEAAVLDVEFEAWRARRFPVTTEQHTFVVPTDELPERDRADAAIEIDPETLLGPNADAARTLGIVVVRIAEIEEDAANFTPELLRTAPGLWFRTARPVLLALYEADDVDGKNVPKAFRLSRVTRVWIVDAESRLGFVRFDSGLFSVGKGAVEFGDTGSLTHLSSSSTAAAQQISEALSKAGTQVQESLDQAQKISEAFDKVRTRGIDRRLADLERRKKLLQADIDLKGALATREDREELERLKLQADLLDARKKLLPEPEPPVDPDKELKARIDRARLELELLQIQAEARWVEREEP